MVVLKMLIVDLSKIKANIEIIRKKTNKDIIAVVKSNAYGLGASHIIPFLKKCGVKYFFVNHFSEYLENKMLFKNSYVIVMDSFREKFEYANVIYTINNLDDAEFYVKTTIPIKIHIQVDTGMNRLGIKMLEDVKKILNILEKNPLIDVEGIYTHFSSCVDDNINYDIQKGKFKEFVSLKKFKIVHSAATSSLHKDIVGNMVRVGLAMYGYGNINLSLKKSLAAYERFINVIEVKKGETVGYQKEKQTTFNKNYLVGVLPVGYYENPNLTRISYRGHIYNKIADSCMNHTHFLIDDKINKLSFLSIIEKNDIIDGEKINWYHYITGLSNYKKIYLMRCINGNIFKILKNTRKKGSKGRIRSRRCKIIGIRTIRI